jgi:hypothetical protein
VAQNMGIVMVDQEGHVKGVTIVKGERSFQMKKK